MFGQTEYLVFDEIQNIEGWELFINRIRPGHKIIVTGSNANLMSSEMATHLTGRFDEWTLFPMSFQEFVRYRGLAPSAQKGVFTTLEKSAYVNAFEEYMMCGGVFERYLFGAAHLRTLFRSIIQRDILGRYDVEYPGLLEELAVYLLNSSGNKISMNKMAARTGLKSLQTARVYARYMETTFLLFTVSKFSWRLKEQQAAMKKAYCSDNGMLSAMLFDISPDKGRFLENLVAIELKRRQARGSGDLFYWDDGSRECDFLIKEGRTITTAIQVCHILTDENRNRELSGLSTAMERFDAGSGLILTADQSEDLLCGHRQVRVVPVWRWMLESN